MKIKYDSLFAEAIPLSESKAGQGLFWKCIETYGGKEHLENLRSFELTYDMNPNFGDSKSIRVVKYYERGRKYKTIRNNPQGVEQRILNGDNAWYVGYDTMIVLDRGRYKAELFSYLTLSMPLAVDYERFDQIRYGTRKDDPFGYYYMSKDDSLMIIIGIDPEDYFVKSSEGVIRQGQETYNFANKFSDFEKFGGYWFAGSLRNISMGLAVGNSKLVKVRINPVFGPEEFEPDPGQESGKSH